MSFMHSFHEGVEHLRIIRENQKRAKKLRQEIVLNEDGFTFKRGEARYLKQICNLHIVVFRKPMLPWLTWMYRLCARELISVVVDENDNVVAYDLFFFEPSEMKENILHELYVAVSPQYQDRGIGVKLRQYSIKCYDEGYVSGLSTLADFDNIKALRTAQKAGYAITKTSAKPHAYYLFKYLTKRYDFF